MIVNTIGGNIGTKLPSLTTPASADKILKGYEVIDQGGNVITGTVETVALTNPTFQFDDVLGKVTASVTAGPGYLDSANAVTDTFDVPITSIATPSVAIDANGLVTATIVQSKGYIGATGTTSATMQLQVRTDNDLTVDSNGVVTAPAGYYPQAAVITASPSAPTISVSSGGLVTAIVGNKQSTHQITSADIPTLTPGNILSGVSIAGVTGNVTGGIKTTATVSTGVSGAVVTAKCGSSTYTATCNSSGVATFNLTKAGTWTFSAAHASSSQYSTQDASIEVPSNFPIRLTVGSSTTVSAPGQYAATLVMACRPSLTTDYKYQSYWNSYAWQVAGTVWDPDNVDSPNFVYASGKNHEDGHPDCDGYSHGNENVNGGGPHNFHSRFHYYYPSGNTSYGGDAYPRDVYDGVHVGRWGSAGAVLKNVNHGSFIDAGGYTPYDGGYLKSVDAFVHTKGSYFFICGTASYEYACSVDPTLEELVPTSEYFKALNMTIGRAWLAASGYYSDINYVLIAGGQTNDSGGVSAVVDWVRIYDIVDNANQCKTQKGTASNLSTARSHLAGICHLNDYILFGGGKNASGSPVATVDAYSSTRVKSSPTALSIGRYNLASAIAAGTFAVFAGGVGANGVSAVVDAYNLDRTRTTPVTLSIARHDMAGFTMGDYAVFAGGRTAISSGATDIVDMIGPNMVRTTTNMKYAKYGCRGCAAPYNSNNVSTYVAYIFGGWSATNGVTSQYERMTLPIT